METITTLQDRPSSAAVELCNTPVAVIGLELMGSSIIACLLAAGHSVLGLTRKRSEKERVPGPDSAKHWEELFLKFSYEIRALAQKYPEHVGD